MIQTLKSYIGYGSLICFVASGIVINLAQILIYILIRPINKTLFRNINHYLLYSSWSQPVAIADWFSNLDCKVYYADEESKRDFCSNSALVIANHRYDIDWLAAWMLSDKRGTLGNDKAMLKASLRHVPVIGWGWSFSDMIFLSRDWKRDQKNLTRYMKVLLTYPNSPTLAYFEGTRFTKAKHDASLKFVEERGLNLKLKHHLVPRSRGFNCMMKIVQDEKSKNKDLKYNLFSMQVALKNDDNNLASLNSVLSGRSTCVHIYVQKLKPESVDFSSEENGTNYLFDIYRDKDKISDYFLKKGEFPGIQVGYKPRLASLVNLTVWLLLTYSTIFYFILTASSSLYMFIFAAILISALAATKLLIDSTRVSKSSSYGTKTVKEN